MSDVFRRPGLPTMRRADAGRASAAVLGTGGRAGAPARSARCAAATLLLALAALLALPLQAQAQTEVWSSTLTVRSSSGVLGCSNGVENNNCSVHLSDDDFRHASTDYEVILIFLRTNGRLEFNLDTNLTTATQGLTLNIDGTAFAFEDADNKGTTTRSWNSTSLSWSVGDSVSLTLTEPAALSTDASLSDLALKDAADDSAIDLNEAFASGTKSYTADVLNAVDEITVEPTSDHNATFAYLNASDTALTDADTLKTGFQAALAAGANTIKVKVTAEDGNSTDTYTVVVTRRAVTTTPSAPPEREVPNDWSLIPTGLGAGDKFRLLFLSSTKTNGESYDIADYNTFIQGRAAAGHTDIRTYSSGFRAVGCTPDSDATANTATTGTGEVIHWLNGNQVADDYADFYDGNWDEESNSQDKNELGTNGPNTNNSGNYPFTGCDDDGTEDVDGGTSYALGESQVRVARPNSGADNAGPLTSNSDTAKTNTRPMYGLSQVFEVAAAGNTPASGAPAITGAAQVGKELTAGLGTIADAEGLPGTFPDDYTFQWVRVDADGTSNEVDITGETSGTYTPVAADVGKKIKVEVSFTDDGSNAEGPLVSAAWPSNAPVAAAAGACPTPNDWCTTLTVGFSQQGPNRFYGLATFISDGALADTTIDDGGGTTWTVSMMNIEEGPVYDYVSISLDAFVPRGSVFDLGGTTFTTDATAEQSTTGRYQWTPPAGFAWVHGQDVTVSVKLPESSPATGAPEISGTPQVGETLTAGIGTIADLDGLPTTFPDDYTYQWIRVDANGRSNPVDVGTDDVEYTLVAADEGKRIKVKVTFTDDAANAEELTSDAYLTSSHRAYPDFGMQPARTACPAGNDWCATMSVGHSNVMGAGTRFGYSASQGHGALDDTSFDYDGSPFTVEAVEIRQPGGSMNYHVSLVLDAFVPRGSVFELNGYEFTASAASEQSSAGHYQWNIPSGFRIAEGVDYRVSLKLGSTITPPCDGVWCATLTVKALDGGNHFGCANAQSGKACSNSSTLTEDEFRHAMTDYAVASVQVRSNGQLRLWVNPDLATGSESLVLHVGSQTFAFQAADTEGANYRYWNNSGLSWSAGEAVALKLTEAVAAEVILPAPRLPAVDDPNAIWMATLTVANLGSNQYGYKGSQGGLTDTAFTYLGDDTPLSGGLGYQTVGTLYTIDELFYDTGTGQLLFSLDGAFVGGRDAHIFVDVGGTRRSFSQALYSSTLHTYTFTFPNPSWSAGDEVTVKIVVLEEANGPESLAATSAESGDGFDVTLTWDAPAGGGTVTGYRVEQQPDPALQWRTLVASQSGTSYADSGLGRGTVRYYRVAALRSGGASYSEVVRVQAPSETTEVPEKVNFVDVEPAEGSDTALEVAWNRPRTPDSRAPATGYHVQYAQHDGAAPAVRAEENWATVTFPRWMERLPWRTWSGVVEAIEFEESTQRSPHLKTVVTGLAPGTNYRVRVRGCTDAGCGDWSYPRRWTTSGATLNATEAEPLTATLEDFPVNHDGSSAFTFRIAFSAEVVISRQDMKEHALVVSGGTVTRARRVDRRKDLWALTVEPAGTGAVSVLVPLERACTETGALCTADGQALSTGLGHSVPGPAPSPQGQQAPAPLAAAFVSVPAEHDGETEFWLELGFDAAVEQGSKEHIRALLGASGGSVTRVRRKDRRLDHWRVRVEPSSHEAVTVTLSPSPACGAAGAVCTQDGRTFTSALATRIEGPPGLTVADAQVREAANAVLAFAVTLSRPPSSTVTVDYATSDDTATAGSDYTAASGTLTFAAGETEKTVSVPVLDDAHDEGSETLTLTLSNASGAYLEDGTATGTINNSDHMPGAWMVRFGRTVGSQVMDALTQRLEGATASHVTVGGIPLTGAPGAVPEAESDDPFGLPDWATRAQREESAQSLTANELLLGSAFHLSSGGGQGAGAAYTAWGRVATSGFEAEVDDMTMDGDVTSGLVGFDAEWERVLAGVMLSHSTGEGGYRLSAESGGKAGSVESSLTGVYPYARVALNARVSAWALAGTASGELTLKEEGGKPMPTDITMRMGAVGFKGRVLGEPGEDSLVLNVKSDAMWVGTKNERTSDMVATQGDVTKLRLTLEGERVFAAGEGATFTPSAEVGLRHDGGDAETGAGLEVGTGLRYVAGVLTVEGKVRTLVAHEDSGYEEWGASGAVRITPSASGRGLMLRFAPQWGRTASAAERLWSAPDATALGAGGAFEGEARLALDAGYGVGLGHGRGVLTPYAGLVLGDAGSRTVRTGARWQVGADAVLGLEGTRRTSGTGEAGNELMLRVALRF